MALAVGWSEGRHHRHSAINDIIHRALTAARVPSRLKPAGLRWQTTRLDHSCTLEEWPAFGVECYLSTHIFPIICVQFYYGSRSCCSSGRGEEAYQVPSAI